MKKGSSPYEFPAVPRVRTHVRVYMYYIYIL